MQTCNARQVNIIIVMAIMGIKVRAIIAVVGIHITVQVIMTVVGAVEALIAVDMMEDITNKCCIGRPTGVALFYTYFVFHTCRLSLLPVEAIKASSGDQVRVCIGAASPL
jgi:hypothetical protein